VQAAYEVLKDHPINQARSTDGNDDTKPANICLPRGCGVRPELPAFEKQNRASGGLAVEVGLIKGLGRFIGMEVADAPGTTGGYDTDHLSLIRTAVELLERNQIVLCNLKAPDVAGHDGKPAEKRRTIAMLDEMAGVLLDTLDLDETVVVVTGDHSTPVGVKDHTGDPLPVLFAGPGVWADETPRFGERPCARGNLGRIRGADVMPLLTNLLGIAEKFGA
jgi:2,3-bisphosphoglycerate-independent phosphoglycerate mutase